MNKVAAQIVKAAKAATIIVPYLITIPAFATTPTLSTVIWDSPEWSCRRATWTTDINSSSFAEFGESTGVYDAPTSPWPRTSGGSALSVRDHSILVCGLEPSTTYYMRVGSTNSGDSAYSAEQSFTTGAQPGTYPGTPTLPTEVDFKGDPPTATGMTRTVGADCRDPSTGFKALLAAMADGDELVIPSTTTNCDFGQVLLEDVAGTDWKIIRSDCANAAPAGVRDHPDTFCHATVWNTYLNFQDVGAGAWTGGSMDDGDPAIIGGSLGFSVEPGGYYYRQSQSAWSLRKATLKGSSCSISNATNATPIVVTCTMHGISNGQTACINGVEGNTNANGCWIAANVSTDTLELTVRNSGGNRGGNAAYTMGGTLRGLEWKDVVPTYADSGDPTDPCTEGDWGHNEDAATFEQGMFRCGTDELWHQQHAWEGGDEPAGSDPTSNNPRSLFIVEEGADKWYVTGLKFKPAPLPMDPEWSYGPRAHGTTDVTPGSQTGGILSGTENTSRIWLDRISVEYDPAGYAMNVVFGEVGASQKPYQFAVTDSWIGGVGKFIVNGVDITESSSVVFDMTAGVGPYWIENNYCEVYGFCWFSQEHHGFGDHGDIEFLRNWVYKNPAYLLGTAEYNASDHTTYRWSLRQTFECKACSRVKISGNVFENNYRDVSPVPQHLALGTQAGPTANSGIWSGSVLTRYGNRPAFDCSAGQHVMDVTNHEILELTDCTASTVTVSGSPTAGAAAISLVESEQSVSDITVTENVFKGAAGAGVMFGVPYSGSAPFPHPRPAFRHLWRDNIIDATDAAVFSGTSVTAIPIIFAAGNAEIQIIHNSVRLTGSGTGCLNFDMNGNTIHQYDGLVLKNNICDFGTTGAYNRNGSTAGTDALDDQFRSGTATYAPNVIVRSGGATGTYPAGTEWMTGHCYTNADAGDFSLTPGCDAREDGAGWSDDMTDMGADIPAILEQLGAFTLGSPVPQSTSVQVPYTVDNAADQCWVIVSDDSFATVTQQADSGSGSSRTPTVSGLEPETMYDGIVACPTSFETFMFTTNALPIGERVRFSGGVRATRGVR